MTKNKKTEKQSNSVEPIKKTNESSELSAPAEMTDQQFRKYVVKILTEQSETLNNISAKLDGTDTELRGIKESIGNIESTLNFQEQTNKLTDEKITENKALIQSQEQLINALTQDVQNLKTKTLNLERHSREFNLRFVGFTETANENSIDVLKKKIKDLKLDVTFEHAHRVGRPREAARPIIAKLLYRPDKFKILKMKNELRRSGIQVYEDLCEEDMVTKKRLAPVMKQYYEEGNKVRFFKGKLYINSQPYEE